MAKTYLLETWRELAYNQERSKKQYDTFWNAYFAQEKEVYKELLKDPETEIKGTVENLAERFGMEVLTMVGFLDGINDSLKKPNPIDKLTESTKVSLAFEPEKLYKNMVKAKADWLYGLEEWDDIIPEEKRKDLFKEEKLSGTVVKDKKVGRNDPCPCGSGRKYKHCCGRV